MDEQFWHQRWQDRNIGFHEGKPNSLLVRHLPRLAIASGDRVFLPLCGKTQDIAYLLSLGLEVVGIELSQIAVDELFAELDIQPSITKMAKLLVYRAPNLIIYVGDFFALNADLLGPVDAIYDRAALVALPLDMRPHYVSTLLSLTDAAAQLLIVFDYDQSQMNGPPFALSTTEVEQHYAQDYACSLLEQRDASELFNKGFEVSENAWLLEPSARQQN